MSHQRFYQPKTQASGGFWATLGVPESGAELLTLVQAGFPFSMFEPLSQLLNMTPLQLARYLRMSSSTLRRRRLAGHFNQEESDRLYRTARVVVAVLQLYEGSVHQALRWMTEPQYGLGGRRPITMLMTSVESDAVLQLIGRLEYGVLA
jgi:putative toxin-antitoxin system antitoxin component (TIGR02293 family)